MLGKAFQDEKSTENSHEMDEDKMQVLFTKQLKQTIEQLRTDVIVANSTNAAANSRHNLFQTFKLTFRMLSLTVLHHDPPVLSSTSSTQATDSSSSCSSGRQSKQQQSNTNRLIVDRMKHISDGYFDWVSTIDTSSSSSTSQASIDKNVIMKYHQACAFNDHFLILMKPINFNMIEKINQRTLGAVKAGGAYFGGSLHHNKQHQQTVQYSLNDISVTVGYIQINEYLVAEKTLNEKAKGKQTSAGGDFSRKFGIKPIKLENSS